MKKILLTGGGGYIARNLIEKFAENYQLIAVDKLFSDDVLKHENVEYHICDITNFMEFSRNAKDLDGVIHLGAISRVSDGLRDPVNCMNVNVMGTMNVLELVRRQEPKTPWVIVAGTNEAATNIYGLSKNTMETCCKIYANNYSIKVVVLKFSTVFGSVFDNPTKLIPVLIKKALLKQEIKLSNSKMSFDFIHIRDLVSGIENTIDSLMKEGASNGRFEQIPLCTGTLTSLKVLAELIVMLTESPSKITIESELEFEMDRISTLPAIELLNFRAQLDLKTGLTQAIDEIKKGLC